MKKLHTFEIKQEKEIEKVDVRQENGQEITVKSKEKAEVPVEIVLKEPSRRERQDLSLFYGISYNEALEKGLMPRVLLVQKFLKGADNPLSQDEDKNLALMYDKQESLRNDFLRVNAIAESEDQKKKKDQLLRDFLSLQKKVTDIEASYRSLFAHTAENYSQNKAITWLVLHLSYVTEGAEQKPLFRGKDYNEKEESLFELEESNDVVYFKAVDKLSTYWSLYFLGQATSPEDFQKIEERLIEELAERDGSDKETAAKEAADKAAREAVAKPAENASSEKTE